MRFVLRHQLVGDRALDRRSYHPRRPRPLRGHEREARADELIAITGSPRPAEPRGASDGLTTDKLVELVGLDRVFAGAAADAVALAVARVHDVVAGAGRNQIPAWPAVDPVGPAARSDPVVARAAPDVEAPAGRGDPVVAPTAGDRCASRADADPVRPGAAVDEVGSQAGVDPVLPGAADEQISTGPTVDVIVARPGLEIVARAAAAHPVIASLGIDLVGVLSSTKLVRPISAYERRRCCDRRERRD